MCMEWEGKSTVHRVEREIKSVNSTLTLFPKNENEAVMGKVRKRGSKVHTPTNASHRSFKCE